MEIMIRPMIAEDKELVEHICIETAPDSMKCNDKRRNFTLLMYNRYYTRVLKHSFVAVNNNDEPIGYILCAPDFAGYYAGFKMNELKLIKKQSFLDYIAAYSEVRFMRKYAEDFPAHLHIDILPEYQGKKIGSKLVDTLTEHLRCMGVHGVMLSVSLQNKGAVAFYKHCGFQVISKGAGIVFGKKI